MLTTSELRRNLITTVIEEWGNQHAFETFTESLVVNTLTRELNNIFRFTIFVLVKNNRSFEVHYQIDDNHELQIIEFKVDYAN